MGISSFCGDFGLPCFLGFRGEDFGLAWGGFPAFMGISVDFKLSRGGFRVIRGSFHGNFGLSWKACRVFVAGFQPFAERISGIRGKNFGR